MSKTTQHFIEKLPLSTDGLAFQNFKHGTENSDCDTHENLAKVLKIKGSEKYTYKNIYSCTCSMQSCFWSFISEVSICTELALHQGSHYNLCQLMLTVE